MTGRGYSDYRIIKVGQNTEKSPGDLSRQQTLKGEFWKD